MKKKQLYNFTLTAMFGTIVLVLSLVPQLGFVTIIPGISITIVHIPVIIGIFLLPLGYSLVLGGVFGLASLLAALIYAVNPLDQAFIMPWISVLPRVLFAFVTFYIIKFFNKIKAVKYSKIISYLLVTVITSFSLYFGILALVENISKSNYNDAYVNLEQAKAEEKSAVEISELEELLELEMTKFNESFPKTKKVTTYVIIGVIIMSIVLYYFIILKKESKYAYIPSAILLSTFIHTILVIGSISLFNPKTMREAFGGNNSLISVILLIALSNGLIEAITASLIATPIVISIKERGEIDVIND